MKRKVSEITNELLQEYYDRELREHIHKMNEDVFFNYNDTDCFGNCFSDADPGL